MWSRALTPGVTPRTRRALMVEDHATLSNLSTENRSFAPSAEFAAQANASADWYDRADADREAFWAEQAERLDWAQKWERAREWDAPVAAWCGGGERGVAYARGHRQ